ncbi:hypothetical protein Aduo_008495 [Ancylostoma duodenale]
MLFALLCFCFGIGFLFFVIALAESLLVFHKFTVVVRLVDEVTVLDPVRSFTSEAGLVSEELGILSDVYEVLDFVIEFLERGLCPPFCKEHERGCQHLMDWPGHRSIRYALFVRACRS